MDNIKDKAKEASHDAVDKVVEKTGQGGAIAGGVATKAKDLSSDVIDKAGDKAKGFLKK